MMVRRKDEANCIACAFLKRCCMLLLLGITMYSLLN